MNDAPPYDDDHIPLARLFALAFRRLTDDLHARLAERGYRDVGRSFGFVLLAARAGPVTVGGVAELLGVSKQAASKLVAQMEERRYLKADSTTPDARSRPLVLSARGRKLLAEVEAIYVALEAEWAQRVGEDGVEAVRSTIFRVLQAQHGGRLPPVRPG